MSRQRVGYKQDQVDEQRCGWEQTGEQRGEWRQCANAERQVEG